MPYVHVSIDPHVAWLCSRQVQVAAVWALIPVEPSIQRPSLATASSVGRLLSVWLAGWLACWFAGFLACARPAGAGLNATIAMCILQTTLCSSSFFCPSLPSSGQRHPSATCSSQHVPGYWDMLWLPLPKHRSRKSRQHNLFVGLPLVAPHHVAA